VGAFADAKIRCCTSASVRSEAEHSGSQ